MPSITNYTGTLKPYNGMGYNRGYLAGPTLILFLFVFIGAQVRTEYFKFVDRQPISHAQLWPNVLATVTHFSSVPITVSDGRSAHHTEYEVRVDYSYKIKGVEHTSQQEIFLDYPYNVSGGLFQWGVHNAHYRADEQKAIESRYAPGSMQPVRYDSTNPNVAYIDVNIAPDGPADQQRRSVIIGAFLIGGLIVAVASSGITKMR